MLFSNSKFIFKSKIIFILNKLTRRKKCKNIVSFLVKIKMWWSFQKIFEEILAVSVKGLIPKTVTLLKIKKCYIIYCTWQLNNSCLFLNMRKNAPAADWKVSHSCEFDNFLSIPRSFLQPEMVLSFLFYHGELPIPDHVKTKRECVCSPGSNCG
jgi:hypothetical protein